MDSSAGTSFFIPKGLKKDTPKDVVTKGITKYNKAQSDYQKQWNEKNNKCVKLEQQLAEAKFKGDTATVNKLQSQIDTLIKEMNSIQDKVNKMSIKSYVDKKYHA